MSHRDTVTKFDFGIYLKTYLIPITVISIIIIIVIVIIVIIIISLIENIENHSFSCRMNKWFI